MNQIDIQVGQVYEDCSLHPVFCTESDGVEVAGISLFDGTAPRSCSLDHCGVRLLSLEETLALVSRRLDFLQAEQQWKENWRLETASSKGDATQVYYANLNQIRNELGLPHG